MLSNDPLHGITLEMILTREEPRGQEKKLKIYICAKIKIRVPIKNQTQTRRQINGMV